VRSDAAMSAPPSSPAWLHLNRLAGILRDVHGLHTYVGLSDDGSPALEVTGRSGTATILAGSVHYWWSLGQGPIGPVEQAGLVAQEIATGCTAPPPTARRDQK
jgi:hypothetical protein